MEKDATEKDIRTAYRKLAVKHHPDKGGDEHYFKEINAAYEILSDQEKRAKYDKYGLEGLDDDGGGGRGGDPHDLFSMFFNGGMGGGGGRRGPRKGDDVNHPLKVSLADLYNGKTVKLAINRQVLIGQPKLCTHCDGQGVVIELRQIALGMVQQLQRRCDKCDGEGYKVKRKKDREILEVLIEKGMRHNQKITFRGKADEKPNMEPGDIHFVVQEQEHEVFKRKGADLLISKTLSLKEALCGFEWKIHHLDQREVVIQSKPGEVIRPQAVGDFGAPFCKIIPKEGMPSHGNPFVKGDLYVLFQVEFPHDGDLSPEVVTSLKQLLPGPSDTMDDHDEEAVEIVHLEHADAKNFGKGGVQNHNTTYESDDEEGGPQAVQCHQS